VANDDRLHGAYYVASRNGSQQGPELWSTGKCGRIVTEGPVTVDLNVAYISNSPLGCCRLQLDRAVKFSNYPFEFTSDIGEAKT
jgi:hypothetical protein